MDDELLGQVADELIEAFEKKDKALLVEALRALILHFGDEDLEQGEST